MKETEQANYRRIKEEVKQIVSDELERIANDDNLKHLLQQKGSSFPKLKTVDFLLSTIFG